MPSVSYPSSCVWYIEGRRWRNNEGKLASAGSGVVVALERLDSQGAPLSPPEIKKYLLTSGHVVRERVTGPLLDELLCWQPGGGYSRLEQRARGAGAMVGASLASVSPLSPCGARRELAPSNLASDDWVLLEIEGPAFQAQAAVEQWADGEGEVPLMVVGYPGGAGVEGQQLWRNGHAVAPHDSRDFRYSRSTADPGMYNYEGGDTRPGMSGGGVFDNMQRLVAIHRSALDIAMQRSAVSASHVRKWLLNRGYRPALFPDWRPLPAPIPQPPVPPAPEPPLPPPPQPPIDGPKIAVAAGVAVVAAAAYFWLVPNVVELHVTVRHQTESGGVGPPAAGVRLGFSPKDFASREIESGTADAQGKAIIKVRVPGSRFDKPPMSGYVVVVAPPAGAASTARYAVRPHGMVERRQGQMTLAYHDPDELNIRAQTQATLYLINEEEWIVSAFTKNVRAASDSELGSQIARAASSAQLSDDASRKATELWAVILAGRRPVLPDTALSETYNRTQQEKVERIVRSVGQVTTNGPTGMAASGTGFMIGKGQLLVPLFALSRSGRGQVSFSGSAPSTDTRALPFRRVAWRSEKLQLALVELEGDAPEPLPVERKPPAVDLAGRRAFVAGYPHVADGRIPAELKSIFSAASGRRAVMPGELLATRSRDEISHDATTTGGVAGGPIVDENSGLVLGVHLKGLWEGGGKRNSGAPTWTLFQDPEFVAAFNQSGLDTTQPELKDDRPAVPPAGLPIVIPYDPRFLGIDVPLPDASATRVKGRVLDYVHFSVFHDERRRMPIFAASNINRALQVDIPRMADRWMYDSRVSRDGQLAQDFYGKSEWDRGHLVNRRSVAWGSEPLARTASQSVFVWTNAVPQTPRFNRQTWQDIEDEVYTKLHRESTKLSVFTGAVFSEADPVDRDVRIPQSFWMVAIYDNPKAPSKPFVHAFMQRQYAASKSDVAGTGAVNVQASITDVAAIEKLTGLKFKLP